MNLKIGSITLDNPTVMAPLAGITNLPFRLLVKKSGCGLVCSEMISANGLAYKSEKTVRLMETTREEKPFSVQLFGDNPEVMAAGAAQIAENHADILDINFGCSVKKVVKTGAGVALMREPEKTEKLLKAVRKAINIPLTIKIRTGWDASGEQALRIAKIAEDCGVDAITVHPRTASQGFTGSAFWPLIGEVKKSVGIPVIGNGDIRHPSDAQKMINETGCDGVMVGRAAMGDPDIFRRINELLSGTHPKPLELKHHFGLLKSYLEMTAQYCGDAHAARLMRSRFGFFVKGLPGASEFRKAATSLKTKKEAESLIESYMSRLFSPSVQSNMTNCDRYLKEPFHFSDYEFSC
jgi:nifR3 family TIM-barrel protein